MSKRIGLIVNPVAGMGGSVGLKGTDGDMYRKALALGASAVAPARTQEFLSHIQYQDEVALFVAPGHMGKDYSDLLGLDAVVVGEIGSETSSEDTRRIAADMRTQRVELLAFVGGDGTARDVCDSIDLTLPVVAVPSGVKVYSSVFAVSARAAAALVDAFVDGAEVSEEEVLDIDEEAFRRGILDAKLYGYLLVPNARQFLQGGKQASGAGGSVLENKKEVAEYMAEQMQQETLYLLGPGTTVKAVADAIAIHKTLLGVDAVFNKRCVGNDLNEKRILELLARYEKRKIIVTPLGGNGFVFGRGNRQFTPEVIRAVGKEHIIVVATRDKLDKLSGLRVDTDDFDLDQALAGYIDVTIGYKYSKLMRIEC